ncbi:MAG: hypothetical protein M3P18_18815, partial [Actinomycetota bacterium]|nr:hypothetical protein [Actinomycetota bacterium]
AVPARRRGFKSLSPLCEKEQCTRCLRAQTIIFSSNRHGCDQPDSLQDDPHDFYEPLKPFGVVLPSQVLHTRKARLSLGGIRRRRDEANSCTRTRAPREA